MADFAEYRARRKRRVVTARLPADPGLYDKVVAKQAELRRVERADKMQNRLPEAPAVKAELEELERTAEEDVLEFTFIELPRRVYRDLILEHPSDDEGRRWNEETFAPALIEAAAHDPTLTEEQAQEVWDDWGDHAAYALFNAAFQAQEGGSEVPLSVSSSDAIPG